MGPTRRPAALVVAAFLLAAVTFAYWRIQLARSERETASREAPVRRLIQDSPLANLALRPSRSFNPFRPPSDALLSRINPIRPGGGLTRPAGPTIDACRETTGGVPAELILRQGVPLPDRASLGRPSARSIGQIGTTSAIEFLTFGRLDVGIKDGAIVAVRVR